jgi:hypothetical protein
MTPMARACSSTHLVCTMSLTEKTLAEVVADNKLLQRPYPDRRQQAEQGRARLSLAPGPSNFFSNAASSQIHSAYQHRRDEGEKRGMLLISFRT